LKTISQQDGVTLTDLAEQTGLAPSTAHRLLTTLAARELVTISDTDQKWSIGVEALRIGVAFQRRNKIAFAGRTDMLALMESTGETVNLGLLDDDDVVFVAQVECREPIRAFFRIGERRAIHCSGIGKAMLAQMPAAKVRGLLQRHVLTRFTTNTIVDAALLSADLEQVRARGWALDNEEANLGMRCIAAPIFNEYGEANAGISLSGPAARLTPERINALGEAVRAAAGRISNSIGGHAATSA
jgi:IclR family transcriptional regulator, acetate operon repressor